MRFISFPENVLAKMISPPMLVVILGFFGLFELIAVIFQKLYYAAVSFVDLLHPDMILFLPFSRGAVWMPLAGGPAIGRLDLFPGNSTSQSQKLPGFF